MDKMADNEWYFDAGDFYIDVLKNKDGTISIFAFNRETNQKLWIDEQDLKT